MNRIAVLRAIGLLSAAMALCGTGAAMAADVASSSGAAYQVAIQNFAFAPKTLTVPVGTRITWTNRDEEPHVVVSAGALFTSSKALDSGDTYTVTFSKPGTYAYYCSIHPMMVGTIIVQ